MPSFRVRLEAHLGSNHHGCDNALDHTRIAGHWHGLRLVFSHRTVVRAAGCRGVSWPSGS